MERRIRDLSERTEAQEMDFLRLATIRGDLTALKSSLQKGISVNQVMKGDWSLLMHAASMGHPHIVEYLLQNGADPNFHKELFTPLMCTCASTMENESKLLKCVELLLQYKANINAMERHRLTPLMFACKEGHAKLVRYLVKSANLNSQDSQGWTALIWAASLGRTEIVEILINSECDQNLKDRQGHTALEIAMSKGLHEIIDLLRGNYSNKFKRNEEEIIYNTLSNFSINNNNQLSKEMELTFEKKLPYESHWKEKRIQEIYSYLNSSSNESPTVTYGGVKDFENCLPVLGMKIWEAFNHLKNTKKPEKFNVQSTQNTTDSSSYNGISTLTQAVNYLEMLHSIVSYVGMQFQISFNDQLSNIDYSSEELKNIAEMTLIQSELLCNELKCFVQKSNKSDSLIPADVITEKYNIEEISISSYIITASIIAIILWKPPVKLFPIFSL